MALSLLLFPLSGFLSLWVEVRCLWFKEPLGMEQFSPCLQGAFRWVAELQVLGTADNDSEHCKAIEGEGKTGRGRKVYWGKLSGAKPWGLRWEKLEGNTDCLKENYYGIPISARMELRTFDKFVISDPHDASVNPVLKVSFTDNFFFLIGDLKNPNPQTWHDQES